MTGAPDPTLRKMKKHIDQNLDEFTRSPSDWWARMNSEHSASRRYVETDALRYPLHVCFWRLSFSCWTHPASLIVILSRSNQCVVA
jgi:hypothetical protein